MYELRLHDDAVADVERIAKDDPEAGFRALVFLQEYLNDEDIRNSLAVEDFSDDVFSVDRITEMRTRGYDLWRAKLMGRDTELGKDPKFLNHRLLYAFDDRNGVIWFLGIFRRDEYDYDPDHPYSRRVKHAYDALGLAHH